MTTQKKRRSGDARQRIVDTILASDVSSQALGKKADVHRFLEQYFANVPFEDLEGRDEDIMARIAVEHLDFGTTRNKGQALLRIFNVSEEEDGYSSAFTFVEMINDDMPFLVDSVAAAINQRGLGVHITVHPIISVRRDGKGKLTGIAPTDSEDAQRESFIRFAITRVTDTKEINALKRNIRKVLTDVRVA
ncbi:MAG: NAD-glutamate dehydrogenase, partial [Woeseiaceae bacterium]